MAGTVVVGMQWGDEGKGRVVDVLAAEHDIVVRYQGGHNAGHTLVVGGVTFALQLVPSGVLSDGVTPVIGNGVVVDPVVLAAEIDDLEGAGVDCSRLLLSSSAHLVLEHHRVLDALEEEIKGDAAIGTTLRGIGPAYADKASRTGARVEDLLRPDVLRERVAQSLALKNPMLIGLGRDPLTVDQIVEPVLGTVAERLVPHVADTPAVLNEALEDGRRVLFEGAQATFLDLDHGTYPFVTSSNPVAGAASVGAGVGPRHLERIVGIAKAYVTRVGAGPFVTELDDEVASHLVDVGHEYGTNTGRRRRVGWFDAVQARQAVRLSTITEVVITKLDVLDGLDRLRVCHAYDLADGTRVRHAPTSSSAVVGARPVYDDLDGWGSLDGGLPETAWAYLGRLEAEMGVPVTYATTGAGRGDEVRMAGGVAAR